MAATLAALFAVLCHEAWITGITVDEPSHLLSADLYWQGKDVLDPRDMPPLIKFAGGWVPRLLQMPLPPPADPVWKTHHEWTISQKLVQNLPGPQLRRFFFWSRVPFTIFPVLIGFVLWWWGRQLFSPATGVLLAILFALEPTCLGHGALFKNDLAAAFGYLLFWYAAWRFWGEPGWRHLLLLTLGLATAILAKLSMLILIPIALVIVPLRSYLSTRNPRRAAGATAFLLAAVYVVSIAAVQFEAARLTPSQLHALRADPSFPSWFGTAALVFRILPVPVPLWQGSISLVGSNASDNFIYLFGKVLRGGHPLYFPAAMAVKIPIALQFMVAGGLMVLLLKLRRRQLEFPWLFVIFPPLLYVGAASMSSLQLGVRLILPAIPLCILIAGALLERLRHAGKGWIGAALAGFMALGTAAVYPYEISYFNLLAGGPEAGSKYLSDSNIDWGQDLPSLARYALAHPGERLRLFYFGNDAPWHYLSDKQIEVLAPPWNDSLARGTIFHPGPGLYAVSATLLPGAVFDNKYRDYFLEFRAMQPIARAGYSIYIYRVDPPAAAGNPGAKPVGSPTSASSSAF